MYPLKNDGDDYGGFIPMELKYDDFEHFWDYWWNDTHYWGEYDYETWSGSYYGITE